MSDDGAQQPAPAGKPAGGALPLRAIAMVLIALAITFFGIGFASRGGSDDSSAAAATTTAAAAATTRAAGSSTSAAESNDPTTTASSSTTTTTTTTSAAASTTTAAAVANLPVQVLNNSTVTGLAGRVAQDVQTAGYQVSLTGNFSAVNLASTTVYYPDDPGAQAQAEKLAASLGGVRTAPRIPALPGPTDSIVVVVVG